MKSVSWNLNFKLLRNILPLVILLGTVFLFSCENDIQTIKTITGPEKLPEAQGHNMEILYSDSGRLKVRIFAPEIRKFSNTEEPHIEFPHGMVVRFYDNQFEVESIIKANYAIYYEEKQFWEAQNNVEAVNRKKGEQLNSEKLFWDEKKELIYSESPTRIVNKDGTFYGENGFEANQRLTRWKLKGSRGQVKIKDE